MKSNSAFANVYIAQSNGSKVGNVFPFDLFELFELL